MDAVFQFVGIIACIVVPIGTILKVGLWIESSFKDLSRDLRAEFTVRCADVSQLTQELLSERRRISSIELNMYSIQSTLDELTTWLRRHESALGELKKATKDKPRKN